MVKTVQEWIAEAKKKEAGLKRFSFKVLAEGVSASTEEINAEALGYVTKGYLKEIYEIRCNGCDKNAGEFEPYTSIPSEIICPLCSLKFSTHGKAHIHYLLQPSSKEGNKQ
jgi:hypothetical protein